MITLLSSTVTRTRAAKGTPYIDRKGLSLQLRDGARDLRAEGERMCSVPLGLIDRVVMRAYAVPSASASATKPGLAPALGVEGRRPQPTQ